MVTAAVTYEVLPRSTVNKIQTAAFHRSPWEYSTVQYSTVGQAVFVAVVACSSHLHQRYKGVLLGFAEILLEHHFRNLAVTSTVKKKKERGRKRPRHQAWLETIPRLPVALECNTQPPAPAATGGYEDIKGDRPLNTKTFRLTVVSVASDARSPGFRKNKARTNKEGGF